MFELKDDKPTDPATLPEAQKMDPDRNGAVDEAALRRHATLIQALHDEHDLQAEERVQMAIDDDYNHHLHWRQEDAAELIERGQAPLVFNEGRQTIEWVCGMQKRLRMDYKILPREKSDEPAAEAKTKVFKYVSDVNLSQWHESYAFNQAVVSGLGWLEEGINTSPEEEQIFTGSEDWRNVYRDSRSRQFDLNVDSRYLFRKKRLDLDYAVALMPWARQHLVQQAGKEGDDRQGNDIWYLGERLTGSTDLSGTNGLLPSQYRDRTAYIGGAQPNDYGRLLSLDVLECWYRMPQSVQIFSGGPLRGKEFDPKNDGHQQLARDRWRMYNAVVNRMRVMVGTESAPLWDGKSPMKHQKFMLVPVWGYRRGRDGMAYGLWRGMRDLNDDLNKRASKALFAASSNRVTFKKGAFSDIEKARQEAARPDMMLEVKELESVRFEKPQADMQMNMELLAFDRDMIRNVGGVTDANLGRESGATSGKAIGLQQDQGSLTTSTLPDNLRLAKQMAGRLRLAHIEQFMTDQQVIRITGEGAPTEWLAINQPQPDGSVLNPMNASAADFIIAERDYRESFAQAALDSMMELLGNIAGYAPQVVMSVLDLVVDSAEIKNKSEWVQRIRKLNGQRDPSKAPTPEEEAAAKKNADDEARAKAIQLETLQAGLDKLRAEVGKLDTDAILKRVESMFSALQAAQIVAMTPNVAPVADTVMQGAGYKDMGGQDPNLPQPKVEPLPQAPGMDPTSIVQAGNVATGMPADPAQAGADPAASMSATGLEGAQGGMQTPTAADNGPAPI